MKGCDIYCLKCDGFTDASGVVSEHLAELIDEIRREVEITFFEDGIQFDKIYIPVKKILEILEAKRNEIEKAASDEID